MTSSRQLLIAPLLSICALCFGATTSHADRARMELSLEDFLSGLNEQLPEFEQIDSTVANARTRVTDARELPALSLGYEREEVFTSGEGVVLKNALIMEWSLDVSGRRGHRTRSAELAVDAARNGGEYQKHLVTLEALRLYKRAARAELRVRSLLTTRAPLVELVKVLKKRVAEGDASGYDLARFELQLTEHSALLGEASVDRAALRAELGAFLGSDADIIATDSLSMPAARPTLEGATARGDLAATRDEEHSGKALTKAASRWWVPTLDLSIGYLNTDFGPGTGPGANTASGYTAMVSASVPIFSRGKAEAKRGQARIRQAQARRKMLDRRIQTNLRTSRALLSARYQQTQQFNETHLVQAVEFAQSTETAYQEGEASALELRDAYAKAAEAQLRYIDLRHEYHLAEIAHWSATGTLGNGASK